MIRLSAVRFSPCRRLLLWGVFMIDFFSAFCNLLFCIFSDSFVECVFFKILVYFTLSFSVIFLFLYIFGSVFKRGAR